MVAARLHWNEDGIIEEAALAVGSCSLVAQRLKALEAALLGQPRSAPIDQLVQTEHLECLSPIDDVRATADYRLYASLVMVQRVLTRLVQV